MAAAILGRCYVRALPVAFGTAVFVTVRDLFVSVDTVRGPSMAPALSPLASETGAKDRVLVWHFKAAQELHRGDVVTFWKPHKPEEISIKRIVALAGDRVEPRDREAGTQAGYGGYGVRKSYVVRGQRTVVVPENHVWLEGDNWRASYDSNDFGPVSRALIDGRAVCVLRKWKLLFVPVKLREDGDTRIVG